MVSQHGRLLAFTAIVFICNLLTASAVRSQSLVAKEAVAPLHDEDNATATKPEKVLYVIGDSHGDHNYLTRCLLSTPFFEVKVTKSKKGNSRSTVVWKSPLPPTTEAFEVVVLGDFTDRGSRSLRNIDMLHSLAVQDSRLKILLGNHESMMFRGRHKYANSSDGDGDLTRIRRQKLLRATEGKQFEVMEWLRSLDIIYRANGVLMAHGGLSETLLEDAWDGVCEEKEDCDGDFVCCANAVAQAFYKDQLDCYRAADAGTEKEDGRRRRDRRKQRHACDDKGDTPPQHIRKYRADKRQDGILWYRGYSAVKNGAGSSESCREAKTVAQRTDTKIFVVAHTTHEEIMKYCDAHDVPIYVVDTHYKDCEENDECDLSASNKFHPATGGFDWEKENIPQSLRLQFFSGEAAPKIDKCTSRLEEVAGSGGDVLVFRDCSNEIAEMEVEEE
eukprot:TRINITY_DN24139_c0_g1_i1.p1 TRINITY_DN24139_c0_g1~~TRINITY_DN24139_c0_g1_i1.p1  ORF type:complete len:445 (+),score=114.71 TRINITY_DN24139_c0_g1_i1:108-1442(+)